ncbi:MAG TPA: FAD/NAD(P)-binding protein [Rhizomicrobium sp.]|jgi:uncharacterized NAD(P)/FAD-binding protein YdhS|nr:FAD/NAD(P)-binding protein [Rhizomicrobium sp.]
MNSLKPFHLVICGGGASAVLLVHALARHAKASLDVTIIEGRPAAGLGRAYSTISDVHFLNVRASGMSADAHDSDHLLRWLNDESQTGKEWTSADFPPRKLYGVYLQSVLQKAGAAPHLRLRTQNGIARDLERDGSGWRIALESGEHIHADAVVLATGNEAPAPIRAPDDVASRVINDPWDREAKARIAPADDVLLLGTGLTAVDLIADLVVGGHTGKIVAMSRHALLPHGHHVQPPDPPWLSAPFPNPRHFMRRLRAELKQSGGKWQPRFDALRAATQSIWQSWPDAQKRRFLRHAKTYWNIHRHRIPPETAQRMAKALADGRLELKSGRLRKLEPGAHGLRVTSEHAGRQQVIETGWLINCTEPNPNPARSPNPLISRLIATGVARPGPLGMGLDVTGQSRIVSREDQAQSGLFALGPLTVGRFWEIVAIPDIRVQAEVVARELAEAAMTPRSS